MIRENNTEPTEPTGEQQESIQGVSFQSPYELLEWDDFNRREISVFNDIKPDVLETSGYLIRKYNIFDEVENTPIEEREPIKIFINSDGGVIRETMALIDLIKSSKTPVWTIIHGKAYSSAMLLAMSGHRRFAYKNSEGLIHDGSYGVMNSTSKVLDSFNNLKRQETIIKKHVLEHSIITPQQYTANYTKEWYLNTEEMIRLKLIDEVLTEIV